MEMDSGTSHKLVKKRTHKKHKTIKRRKQNDSSGDESVDMSKEVFPIAHYISNRDQMIEQVFTVMAKEKLNCMLPPVLKGLSLSALKESCLKELKSMSDEEVRKVLCGDPLETTSDNNPLTLQLDSDSGDSSSSVQECGNVEEKKKTLLDILEQEMQEIAYNTVLKRDENTVHSTDSDDDLPEIVAIAPTNSCKPQNSVPLICIDSEDEDVPPNQQLTSNVNKSCTVHCENSINIRENHTKNFTESVSQEIPINQTLENDTTLPDIHATMEESEDLNTSLNKSSVSSQESFLIKVFSNNNSHSERIVKQFFKCSNDKDADILSAVNNKEHEINKLEGRDNNTSQSIQDSIEEIVVLDLVEDESSDSDKPDSLHSQSELDITKSAGGASSIISFELNDSNSLNNDSTIEAPVGNDEPLLNEEKEEGEISEEDSDEDVEVVGTLDDKEQSPTVCVSSDSSSEKNDSEKSKSKTREKKHHHKYKKNKHRTNSPERSRRRIEKRGNRSYRRKTVIDKAPSPEKYQESTMQEIDLNSISLPPGEMPKKPSLPTEDCAETPTLELDNVVEHPLVEDIVKETTENVIPPSNSKELVDEKCSFSEELEESDAGEPVSTKTSWADRWAEKKDLKKVVITSKICRNVRKRILSARKKQTVVEPVCTSVPVLPPVPPLVLHVEGSVQEYQMLQLLVSNGSDEENSGSRSVEAANSPDTVASVSTTNSNIPGGDGLPSKLEVAEDQQEKKT